MPKKKLQYLSLLLFLTYLLNICVPCIPVRAEAMSMPVSSFSDITGHWAEKGITNWTARGLAGGYPDGTFRPDSPITRAEFLTLLNRAFGYTEMTVGQAIGPASYCDVTEIDWYAGEIAKAAAVGYLGGYPDGTIRPQNSLTRQEVAVFFARILPVAIEPSENDQAENLHLNDNPYLIRDDVLKDFINEAQIPEWSREAIAMAVSGGYMNGYPDGTFRPAKAITRAEAITVLKRAVGTLYNSPGTYGPFRGNLVLEGNVTITTPSVTLQNTTITGNLYLTEGIGEGEVTLDNVTVQGTTKIGGGGSDSIHLIDTTIGSVLVNVPNRNLVRLLAQGSTAVGTLEARTPVRLEEKELTASGFTRVRINNQQETPIIVELLGELSEVEIHSPAVQLNVQKGSIHSLTLASTSQAPQTPKAAQSVQINLAAQTAVANLIADIPVVAQGQGTIETTLANVDGVVIETPAKNVLLVDGVRATVEGKTITESIIGAEIKKKKSKDATLSDLMINGTTVPDFTADTLSYKVVLPYGTKEAPVVTAKVHHTKAKVEITQAEGFTSSNNTATILVTAESGSTQTYTVNFTVALNFAKAITDFRFAGLDPVVVGTISEDVKTISVTVPYGTDVTSLIPTITHTGASISPTSGAEQDFTESVTYTVTAADGTTVNYVVIVNIALNSEVSLNTFKIGGQDVLSLPDVTTEKGAILSVSNFAGFQGIVVEATDSKATVTVTLNGEVVSEEALAIQAIAANDVIAVTIVAEDGETTGQYKVKAVPVLVTAITVTGAGGASTVEKDQILQMSANIEPLAATDKTVTWSVTTGTGSATIDETGLLTGTAEGTVTVTATANDGSDVEGSLEVTVVISVTGVGLSKAVMFLQEGTRAEEPLIATVEPSGATNKDVTWSSSDETIAIVDATGLVTAISIGTAKIIAITVDGGKTATCEVMVVGSDPIIDDSCVLYLDGRYGTNAPATQTWYDLSSKGNDGTLNNFTYEAGSGWTGQGLEFDGENDYVDCGNNESVNFGTGSFSASFWFKTTSTNTGNSNALIGKKSTAQSYFAGYHINVTGGKLAMQLADGTNYISKGTINSTKAVNDGTWHFGGAVVDRSDDMAYIYVDGIQEASISIANITGNTDNAYNTIIGAGAGGGFHRFTGSINDICIYNRALTDREIMQNYLATKTPMPLEHVDGAVLDLRGTEGTNGPPPTTVWQDSSGHGNHATLQNVAFTAGDGWSLMEWIVTRK